MLERGAVADGHTAARGSSVGGPRFLAGGPTVATPRTRACPSATAPSVRGRAHQQRRRASAGVPISNGAERPRACPSATAPCYHRRAMLKHNSYFDGKIQSIGFERLGRRLTSGVIDRGEFHFNTDAPERMTVTSGE